LPKRLYEQIARDTQIFFLVVVNVLFNEQSWMTRNIKIVVRKCRLVNIIYKSVGTQFMTVCRRRTPNKKFISSPKTNNKEEKGTQLFIVGLRPTPTKGTQLFIVGLRPTPTKGTQ